MKLTDFDKVKVLREKRDSLRRKIESMSKAEYVEVGGVCGFTDDIAKAAIDAIERCLVAEIININCELRALGVAVDD